MASSYEVTLAPAPGGRWATPRCVRSTSHFQGTFLRAHLEEGSGRSETSPTAILKDTHSLEEAFHAANLAKAPRYTFRLYTWQEGASRKARVASPVSLRTIT